MTLVAERGIIKGSLVEVKGESVTDFEEAKRIGSESIYPAPGVVLGTGQEDELDALVDALHNVSVSPDDFAEVTTFEQLFAAIYAYKFKTMIAKQKDYGPENITKAGEKGILTRTQDKLERLKILVGDEARQVEQLKRLLDDEPETLTEMNNFLNKMEGILFPSPENESVLDNWGDMGNYGDIGVAVHTGAWPKPLA